MGWYKTVLDIEKIKNDGITAAYVVTAIGKWKIFNIKNY